MERRKQATPGSSTGYVQSVYEGVGALFSKRARQTYLRAFLFLGTAISLLCISAVAYLIFYYKYIPQIGLERVVYLQFGDGPPWGTAPLNSKLVSLQPYDVSVRLELPRTPSNLAAGNFMLDLTLSSHPYKTSPVSGANMTTTPLARSRRPGILTYASPLVDTASKLSRLPFYLTGWRREAEILDVRMMEGIEFPRGWRNLPDSFRLDLYSDEKMQVYDAKVEFTARFNGLRWIMYNWRLTSFFVFTTMFWGVSVTTTGAVWLILASLFGKYTEEREREIKRDDSEEAYIKEEPDDDDDDDNDDDHDGTPEPGPSRLPGPGVKEEEDDDDGLGEEAGSSAPTSETESEGTARGESGSGSGSGTGSGTAFQSPGAGEMQRRRRQSGRDNA